MGMRLALDQDYNRLLYIIGSNTGDTMIKCAPLTGLKVVSSGQIIFKSIVLIGCGRENHIFIYYYYSNSNCSSFHAALFIDNCYTVTFHSVSIMYSKGTGLFLYQLDGNLLIENSSIIYGAASTTQHSDSIIGGGIVVIDCSGGGTFIITNSNITHNQYEDNSDDYCNIVSGGAIVLYDCGGVIIDSCMIVNNSRGFVINNVLAFDIYNTTIMNRNNSKIVPDSDVVLMVNMVMSDNLTIFVPNTEMNSQDIFDGYQMWNQ